MKTKMIKINKVTHISLLFTFAVVFISVYLYYTIVDVKHLKREVKKIMDDVGGLTKLATELTKRITDTMNINEHLVRELNKLVVKYPSKQDNEQLDDDVDDETSINSEQVKNMLVNDEDDNESISVASSGKQNEDDDKTVDGDIKDILDEEEGVAEVIIPKKPEELKALKYGDLKDLAKSLNLSQNGTKDVLTKRIIDFQAL